MTITIYGIKNCDTMKKARTWLDAHDIEYRFHDYKTDGIDRTRLEGWCRALGWEVLLNRAGTTFRRLPETAKQSLNASKALDLMMEQPSMIKRPVLDLDGRLVVGFNQKTYATSMCNGG